MKLHIFNPEHEMALAMNKDSFMLPHNIQEFRMNMGFLPALWAADGDCVLVDDVAYAVKALAQTALPHADVLFLTDADLHYMNFDGVEPWGWDGALCHRLILAGVAGSLLPSADGLATIRSLANRRLTTDVLMAVREGLGTDTCGKSFYITEFGCVGRLLASFGRIVLKAPWSSSGRGVRYVGTTINQNIGAWASGIIKRQGGIMVEPHYARVADFAMEFKSDGVGGIEYCGLSVFKTEHANYTGNVIATETEKMAMLARYIQPELIAEVRGRLERFFANILNKRYRGPFGVDMMVVADADGGRCKLHPCVEINFRRTMGHVANSLATSEIEPQRLMSITHGVNYTLKVTTPERDFVKVL